MLGLKGIESVQGVEDLLDPRLSRIDVFHSPDECLDAELCITLDFLHLVHGEGRFSVWAAHRLHRHPLDTIQIDQETHLCQALGSLRKASHVCVTVLVPVIGTRTGLHMYRGRSKGQYLIFPDRGVTPAGQVGIT